MKPYIKTFLVMVVAFLAAALMGYGIFEWFMFVDALGVKGIAGAILAVLPAALIAAAYSAWVIHGKEGKS